MEVLAVDFDGVLRKWPRFVAWYFNFLRPDDLLVRAKLFFIRRMFTQIFVDYIPVIIDGKLVVSIQLYKPHKLLLVSGRVLERQKKEVIRKLSPFLNIDEFHFREDPQESEWKFKERILKKEKVDVFIEDRDFIVKYLQRKGINAIHIRDVRE